MAEPAMLAMTTVVTVTVKDSSGANTASDVQNVAITVTNVAEAPGAVAAPTVVSTDSDERPSDLRVEGDLVRPRRHGGRSYGLRSGV